VTNNVLYGVLECIKFANGAPFCFCIAVDECHPYQMRGLSDSPFLVIADTFCGFCGFYVVFCVFCVFCLQFMLVLFFALLFSLFFVNSEVERFLS